MGVKLLFRTAQGVQATEAGALLLHHAREIVSRFEEVEHCDPRRGCGADRRSGDRSALVHR